MSINDTKSKKESAGSCPAAMSGYVFHSSDYLQGYSAGYNDAKNQFIQDLKIEIEAIKNSMPFYESSCTISVNGNSIDDET